MAVQGKGHQNDGMELDSLSGDGLPPLVDGPLTKPKISLQQAARDGKYEVVKEWLEWYEANPMTDRKGRKLKKSPINEKDPDGMTALHYAARFNRYDILAHLLIEKPDVNVKNDYGFTALHYAAKYLPRILDANEASQLESDSQTAVTKNSSSAKAISLLLQSQANVNAQDKDGGTPLMVACQRGNKFAVERLLRAERIEVNVLDLQGDTALHDACQDGDDKIVEMLLRAGADMTTQNQDGVTPLHIGCREGHVEIAKLILLHGNAKKRELVEASDTHGATALHYAVESNCEEIVKVILLNGGNPVALKKNEVTPLHIAARNGSIPIAKCLLGYEAQSPGMLEMTEENQNTPLHFAARFDRCEMIDFLVHKGANLEALDIESFTPLLTAVSWDNIDAVQSLITLGAEVDTVDKDGKSGVFWAVELDNVEILKVFEAHVQGKSLFTGTDGFNNHLLHIACQHGNDMCLKYLLDQEHKLKTACRNEVIQTPLHLAAKHGHIQCIKQMVYVNKELIPLTDDNGNTALHVACIEGYGHIAQALIDEGAAVDARNDKLWTPMDCAAEQGHAKIIKLLIDNEAPIDAKDKSLDTPLTLACREGHLKCVKVLVENGADVKLTAQSGYNCLDIAIEHGHEDIAGYLVRCKQWRNVLRNCVNGVTPLRRLIRKMPDIAEDVFNNCTTHNSGGTVTVNGREVPVTQDSKHFAVTFDYEFLEDFQESQSHDKQKQSVTIRNQDGINKSVSTQHLETAGSSIHEDDLSESDEGFIRKSAVGFFSRCFGIHETWSNRWGPVGFKKENHVMNVMVDSKRINLLSHPLVTSLQRAKWKSFGRVLYWINLCSFLIFLAFLTVYALLLPPPNEATCKDENVCAVFNSTNMNLSMFGSDDCKCQESLCDYTQAQRTFLRVAAAFVILFCIIRLIIEFSQMVQGLFSYWGDWENWIELALFISAIVFASGAYIHCCVCVQNWQWQLGALAVLFAWLDLVLFMKKLPLFGVYVVMFIQIIYTFLRFMALAVLFIVAFGLAFYMLFVDGNLRPPFQNPFRSLVKTMVMTTGEFEFDTIFFENTLDFTVISYILWIIFIILMPILLTNLLVGLAVDDIKQVQQEAELKRLALQVELALNAEEVFPRSLRRLLLHKNSTVYPNRDDKWWEVLQSFWGVERFDAPVKIRRVIYDEPDPEELLQQQNRRLMEEVNSLKATVNEMSLLVVKMAEQQGIKLKELDNKT